MTETDVVWIGKRFVTEVGTAWTEVMNKTAPTVLVRLLSYIHQFKYFCFRLECNLQLFFSL